MDTIINKKKEPVEEIVNCKILANILKDLNILTIESSKQSVTRDNKEYEIETSCVITIGMPKK